MKKLLIPPSLLLLGTSAIVQAHGSMELPISRSYQCYKEGPENPKSEACKAAVAVGGKQAIYNWHEINQGAANDRHQAIIPDGTLCAGGRDLFQGLNLAREDWPTTLMNVEPNRPFQFIYHATAPHRTKYFKFYLTKDNYVPSQPLRWGDLDEAFCTITSVTLENGRYKMNCPIPANKTGKHILYVIWQRADSPEAFYSCSDVFIKQATSTASWHELDTLYNTADVVPGTTAYLRLFKNGSEVESHSIVTDQSNSSATQWPYTLAQKVNSQSNLLQIGQLDPASGNIILTPGSAYKVYIKDNNVSNYRMAVDLKNPGEIVDYIYPDGIANYKAGTIVMGRNDHKRYQCKPWPYSSWCTQSPAYYEPGVGLAWTQAWNLLN
ncbi:secreted cellulose-binding protein [Legionella busanensis]|uniref:Secreted cellulose-binding protein n=1 Tax=Legionella busanensis TaxID=190655 RepID=A0A378JIS5_9GAMM|nr:lytic polysaccharide monooxygenase [Legionella busanensis]STX50661.1 secreted cellulose-binding protein [Legionella busanensis]